MTIEASPLQYTNIAVKPDGTLCPWLTRKTTTHPPVLKFDGQILWLPSESAKSGRNKNT